MRNKEVHYVTCGSKRSRELAKQRASVFSVVTFTKTYSFFALDQYIYEEATQFVMG